MSFLTRFVLFDNDLQIQLHERTKHSFGTIYGFFLKVLIPRAD